MNDTRDLLMAAALQHVPEPMDVDAEPHLGLFRTPREGRGQVDDSVDIFKAAGHDTVVTNVEMDDLTLIPRAIEVGQFVPGLRVQIDRPNLVSSGKIAQHRTADPARRTEHGHMHVFCPFDSGNPETPHPAWAVLSSNPSELTRPSHEVRLADSVLGFQ